MIKTKPENKEEMKIEWIEKYMTDAEHLIYNNQLQDGLGLLNELLYDEPGYGSLHNHLGWAYMYYTGDTARAELHLKMAIRFNSEYAAPYLHIGNLYIRMARYAEALDYLTKGLQKQNANRLAFLEGIGQVYEYQKSYAKAIRTYKEALAASVGFENTAMMDGIKRCRKKRLVMMFNF